MGRLFELVMYMERVKWLFEIFWKGNFNNLLWINEYIGIYWEKVVRFFINFEFVGESWKVIEKLSIDPSFG